MTNRLRTEIPEAEIEKEIVVEEKQPVKDYSENALLKLFAKNFNAEKATGALPFVLFMVLFVLFMALFVLFMAMLVLLMVLFVFLMVLFGLFSELLFKLLRVN